MFKFRGVRGGDDVWPLSHQVRWAPLILQSIVVYQEAMLKEEAPSDDPAGEPEIQGESASRC
jgi:hypothetical protein